MKKTFFTLIISVAVCAGINAQYCGNSGPGVCTPSGTLTQPGLSPNSHELAPVINGTNNSVIIQFKNFNTFNFGGNTVTVQSIKLDSIGNLPGGLCWATNKANNTWGNQEDGCIKVSGTANGSIGQYKLKIIVTANIGTNIPGLDADAVGLKYFVRLINPGGNTPCIDTTAGAFKPYTGNEPNCPVSIDEPSNSISTVQIQPNPMSTSAVVSFYSDKNTTANVRLTNLLGSVVSSQFIDVNAGENTFELERNNLPKGVYMLTISTGKNSVTRRIIITE
ncbi:MAG: T9SS type A sorting domain-containing protein [Chitinophagales bacterium]|nr:T9SS type A sorting domain-containing protein [Chitinophagales bacterium]MDW8419477.1 T9SS type A sorting domain-containing protein [Chitinophagales bacterium]